jgi:hypothetical protein
MKRYLFTILFASAITNVFSQTNKFPDNGNAGIGTVNPQANLDIFRAYDANNTRSLKMYYQGSWGFASYASSFRFLDIESTEGGKILQLSGYGMGLGFDPPAYLSPDKLYVNGNVGIGTTAPITTLQVQNANTSYASTLVLKNTANHIAARAGITLENDNGNQTMFYKQASGNSDANDLILYSSAGDTRVYTSGAERFRITNSGNIGIGTTDPKGYKLAVAGNMIAESVKVQLKGSWADYVFEDDYKLKTLEETEAFVKKNKHLPEIPSAAEVKTNGIDVGEMNAKLLKKIEELTLHLIEKEKKDNDQQKQIDLLKVQVDNLLKSNKKSK